MSIEEKELFDLFKYTKNVFLGRIDYLDSKVEVVYEDEGKAYIDLVGNPRSLEVICHKGVVVNGICAFRKETQALILNSDYAHGEFLDESNLRILFIGENFKGFVGSLLHLDRIKYLYVHKNNPYFEAKNNKLVEKKSSR